MQQVLDLCPRCGSNLDVREVPPEWASFYPDQKRWNRKQKIKFRDPLDGEVYEIWKCTDCGHTWEDGETEND
jgi:predicted  nucleic acid-binding Zn-ribbon protein